MCAVCTCSQAGHTTRTVRGDRGVAGGGGAAWLAARTARDDAEGALLVAVVAHKVDHPDHAAIDARLGLVLVLVLAGDVGTAAVAPRLVPSVAAADLAVVDAGLLLHDLVHVAHRFRVVDQHVKTATNRNV